jgi:glutamate-1-semialdehyde 2,1-aminomutase
MAAGLAGLAGLRELWTPAAIEALDQRGDRLRDRCNALFRARGLAQQCSGLDSLMTLHATDRPLHNAADLAGSDPRLRASAQMLILGPGARPGGGTCNIDNAK